MDYKLSTVLIGHLLDVRDLAVTPEGYIVSVSRDKTVKLWKPNSENNGFTDVQIFRHHDGKIMCATVLNNTEVLPYGIILTSSYDKKIIGFIPHSTKPILIENGHKETVCKLSPGVSPNTFISSSWDATARLWQIIKESEECFRALLIAICNGHSMSVSSAIQLPTKHIITASADKTINVHVIVSGKRDKSTTIIKKLTGHTDCVRDLAVLKDTEFLSCSNDATVKLWNLLTGECETFYSHSSNIYSLCVFRDELNSTVVIGGEDGYVNVWQSSNQQVILQPAQRILAVTVLQNSDIVTGSSDGLIRIFSKDFKRQASQEVLAAFQQEVENGNQAAQKEIGGIQVDSLPGPEVLLTSGKSDGQIIMVNENEKPIVYKWLSNGSKWDKIGDVLSGSDKTKIMHGGKEYDYVWIVRIEDGKPTLKLPFNKSEEPWLVAEQFIHKNSLPRSYINTIANFIKSQIIYDSNNLTATKIHKVAPYTGGAKYVPISSKRPALFPQTDYIKFDQGSVQVIIDKLEYFNREINEKFYKLSKNDLNSLLGLLESDSHPDKESIDLLMSLVCDWPHEILFPILDILRLALCNEHVNEVLCLDDIIMINLLPHIHNIKNPMNQMISFRCLCNLMQYEIGELLILKYHEEIITFIQQLETNLSQNHLQIAISTFLLNLSVMIIQTDKAVAIQNVTNTINAVCLKLKDPYAMQYCFVAIGTLSSLKSPPTLSDQIRDYIELIATSNYESSEVLDCCNDIMTILSKK